jgi:hypothetical protein
MVRDWISERGNKSVAVRVCKKNGKNVVVARALFSDKGSGQADAVSGLRTDATFFGRLHICTSIRPFRWPRLHNPCRMLHATPHPYRR